MKQINVHTFIDAIS